jgi:hypothetical protein
MDGLSGGAYDELITTGLDALLHQSALEAHTAPVDQSKVALTAM